MVSGNSTKAVRMLTRTSLWYHDVMTSAEITVIGLFVSDLRVQLFKIINTTVTIFWYPEKIRCSLQFFKM